MAQKIHVFDVQYSLNYTFKLNYIHQLPDVFGVRPNIIIPNKNDNNNLMWLKMGKENLKSQPMYSWMFWFPKEDLTPCWASS